MTYRLREAIERWNKEAEAEAVRLIEQGTPPFEAIEQAKEIVRRRRAEKCPSPSPQN